MEQLIHKGVTTHILNSPHTPGVLFNNHHYLPQQHQHQKPVCAKWGCAVRTEPGPAVRAVNQAVLERSHRNHEQRSTATITVRRKQRALCHLCGWPSARISQFENAIGDIGLTKVRLLYIKCGCIEFWWGLGFRSRFTLYVIGREENSAQRQYMSLGHCAFQGFYGPDCPEDHRSPRLLCAR